MNTRSLLSGSWTPRRIARWEKTRSRGEVYFVFVYGLIFFGGLTIALKLLVAYFFRIDQFSWREALFVQPIGGLIWGIFMWHYMEAGYRSYQSRCELERLEALQSAPPS